MRRLAPLLTRLFSVAAATLAGAAFVALAPDADAGRRGDELSAAAKTFRKAFKSDARDAEKTFSGVAATLTKGLSAGTTSAQDAVTGFGDALAFYARALHAAAADASEGFAGEAVKRMSTSGDPSLPGAAAGDGGSLDAFAEGLRGDLVKLRSRARKRTTKFQKAFARAPGHRGGLRATFEDWTFTFRPAPDVGGAAKAVAEPARLWGALAARLTDGRIVMAAFGPADSALDNAFDVRLERGFDVRALGDFLVDGGMNADTTGWWSFSGVINDPFGGDTVDEGNAQIHFGLAPGPGGTATRLVHGGLLSLP